MVKIITDSAADFEPQELERLSVSCIPLTVIFDETEYQENVNLSKDQFYELLKASKALPKTAQASPQLLLDLFEGADEAIYICLSSALSGTYQSACMVQQMTGKPGCHVFDSRNATGGQRMIVEHAVKLRDQGLSAPEIITALELLRDQVVLYACMDTLENLYMGGRISQTIYKLGSIANIKPIITVDNAGRVQVPAKAMGTRKGVEYLCKQPGLKPPSADFPFYVMYTDNREAGIALARQLNAQGFAIPDRQILQVGAAIGTHIGPNAVGFVYIAQ